MSFPATSATLPSGASMPLLGFGTWQLKGAEATAATLSALEAGYRHLDTAHVYGNEKEVGAALAQSGVPREEVFVTTKVPPHKADDARGVLQQSLDDLGIEALDLWLIHWSPEDGGNGLDLWQHLVHAQGHGLTKDIGVSNYNTGQIDELAEATGVKPAVNQIEWSPLIFDRGQLEGHASRGVVLEGYSALRGGTIEDPTIGGIAAKLGRTPAQVIIRWHLQHDTVVIPKSRDAARIASNADVAGFELSADDMAAVDALGKG